jgi:hypothetical protein
LILYKKSASLRVRRLPVPEPPWWAATLVSPYTGRRGTPVSIDYFDMSASWSDKLEVAVADHPDIEAAKLAEPVAIDATEFAEVVFKRGQELLRKCPGSTFIASSSGAIPEDIPETSTIAIVPWPVDFARLEPLCAAAASSRWGLVIPVMFPATTDLEQLTQLADLAAANGASFLAAATVDLDPTAKNAVAKTLSLDEDSYATLFHADLDPIHTATERHIAALAEERGLADVLPGSVEKSNWNASALLTLTASRMIAMERDIETATIIARSARAVAELNKPIARIAEAASLSIVEALDEVSVEILTEWLSGATPWFVDRVNREWRLRRDAGATSS